MTKKMIALALALAGAMSVSACQTSQQTGTLAGGAIGAGTGRIRGFGRRCRRRHRGRRDRRRHGRVDRKRRDTSAPPLRAMGFRSKRQPRLPGLLPLTKPRAVAHQSAVDVPRLEVRGR